jgi:replicative DNA helicase
MPNSVITNAWLEAALTTTDKPKGRDAESVAEQLTWRLDSDTGSMVPRSALDVLVDLNDNVASGRFGEYQPIPLGFPLLDKTIGGGLRAGELMLIGGAQGTGKTTMAMQMARNVASSGQANVLYICFEHEEQYLLNRLIALESALAHLPQKTGAISIQDVRKEIMASGMAENQGGAGLTANQRLRPSLDRIARYGQNLFLLRGSQTASTIENIRKLIQRHRVLSGDRRLFVVVDYMQKVPMYPEAPTESEKVTYVVNGLKDIALTEQVAMISIVAADKEASRLRGSETTICAVRRPSTTRPTSF